jgi:hypothetical protein
MVMKMAKSTLVLINEGSFCARNLLAGTSGISSTRNPFRDFDSRFRLTPFASRIGVCTSAAVALTVLTFFSN